MNKDVLRAIGHLNLVLDEYRGNLWDEEVDDLARAIRILQRLAKR